MSPDKNAEDKFRYIYDCYNPLLRQIALKKSIPYDEIDDIVQEAYFSYYLHYPITWPESKIKSMLSNITRNLCNDYFRKLYTHPLIYIDITLFDVEEKLLYMQSRGDPLEIILEKQEFLDVLKTMKDDWLIIFLFYIVQGRSIKDISKILNISQSACRMRLKRGREYLYDTLVEKYNDKYPPSKHKKTKTAQIASEIIQKKSQLKFYWRPNTNQIIIYI